MKRSTIFSVPAILVFSVAFWGVTAPDLSAQQNEQAVQQELQAQENLSASVALSANIGEQQKAETARGEAREPLGETVTKTYTLKYASFREVANAASLYIYTSSGSADTITVRLPRKYVADFEALLKKLDVEKKNIVFRVYTIIASREIPAESFKRPETTEIDNRDLKNVLDELKGLWNFKHYWVDAPSLLTVKEGSTSNYFKLVSSQFDFGLMLESVRLGGDEPGKRIISVGSVLLTQYFNAPSEESKSTLIGTKDVSIKEKGYLVVGVSGLATSRSGLALILVIGAEVK